MRAFLVSLAVCAAISVVAGLVLTYLGMSSADMFTASQGSVRL